MEAALAVVLEGGYEALSLRAVAARAGVSHSAPYRHFAGKTELWSAVAEECFRGLYESMQRAAGQAVDPIERYLQLGVGYIEYGLEHPDHYRVMFGPVPGEDCEPGRQCFEALVESIREAQRAGAMRPGDPLKMALGSWSLVHGLTSLCLDDRLQKNPAFGQDRSQLFREVALLQLGGYSAETNAG